MTHNMTLISEHEGTEEWYCPICGRDFLVEWHPEYRMEIIVTGDINAGHAGSKGGLSIGHIEIESDDGGGKA